MTSWKHRQMRERTPRSNAISAAGTQLMRLHPGWLVGILAGTVSGCSFDDTDRGDETIEQTKQLTTAAAEGTFDHPLLPRNWSDLGIDGLPFRDTWTGPNGGALAVQVGFSQDEQGNVIQSSGLVELEQRMLTPEELAENEKREATRVPPTAAKVVPDDVVAMANNPTPSVFSVSLRRDGVEQVLDLINRDIMLGLVNSEADYAAARERALESRRVVLRQRQAPVAADVVALGGRVVSRCQTLFCLTVEMTAAQLIRLVNRNPDIDRVDAKHASVTATGDQGASVAAGSQITPMLLNGWDGMSPFFGRVKFGLIDTGVPSWTHLGFNDTSSGGSRILARVSCFPTCVVQTTPCCVGIHGTQMAGLLIGDLNDGQDPAITDGNDRWDKSGYSHEASLAYAIQTLNDIDFINALDFLISQTNPPWLVSASINFETDSTCAGQNTESRKANDLFEDNQLLFNSTGNGAGSSTDCTVKSPGSAVGVFTVGAHSSDSGGITPITVTEVRSDGIWFNSAYGGNATEGQNRSIIDLTAYGSRRELFDVSGGYSGADYGTSFATPTAAAAAANFQEFFGPVDAGSLYVNMLLMGDRKGQANYLSTKFDSLWGAGRLRMRTFDAPGLDQPAEWLTGFVCVGHGATVLVNLNDGSAIPATVNFLKAAIYWYDSRHESQGIIANIDLKLRNVSSGGAVTSDSLYDEKERIAYSSAAGKIMRLELIGTNVTGANMGCGTNSMRVWYAVFWEDSARDDADGPSNVGAGTGSTDVVPESTQP